MNRGFNDINWLRKSGKRRIRMAAKFDLNDDGVVVVMGLVLAVAFCQTSWLRKVSRSFVWKREDGIYHKIIKTTSGLVLARSVADARTSGDWRVSKDFLGCRRGLLRL